MTNTPQQLGHWGETLAAKYLTQQGFLILAQNARTPHGEIDLVTRRGNVTVFVEVKTRASTAYGHPEESITPTKKTHLLASAVSYLQLHPELDGDWKIDVLAIRSKKNAPAEIVHFENAVGDA